MIASSALKFGAQALNADSRQIVTIPSPESVVRQIENRPSSPVPVARQIENRPPSPVPVAERGFVLLKPIGSRENPILIDETSEDSERFSPAFAESVKVKQEANNSFLDSINDYFFKNVKPSNTLKIKSRN